MARLQLAAKRSPPNSSACHIQDSAENEQRAQARSGTFSPLSIHRCHAQQNLGFKPTAAESFRRLEPSSPSGFLIVRPELTCGPSPQSARFQDRRPDLRLLSVTESVALPPVLVGARAMPEIQKSILPPRQTTGRRCSVCQSRMEIQRIARARAGFEHWTCRCIRCGHIDQVQVNVDPLKSEAQGLQE
jgi:hypothetical protein